MYALDDTIAAISTPIGQGGIGIVRLSGPDAMPIARRIFTSPGNQQATLESHHLYYGHIISPISGRRVDEVLLSVMRAPHTYTRQDMVEINAHGGLMPLREVLALCLEAGARMAHEGEFTLRAFLNGRIDLAQAEAVLDVITARTAASLRIAVDQLGGRLSGRIRAIRAQLVSLLAYLQAAIDFPEDEIPPRDVGADLGQAAQALMDLLREAERGMIYREGFRVAIVGRPNVGKSSLLNRLLRTERAIVTPIPGTTRDTLEETIALQGVPFVLVDTAGINASQDLIERLGIERSRQSIARADVALVVVDGSLPPMPEDYEVAHLAEGKVALVVLNKSDLPGLADYAGLLPTTRHLALSAVTGEGIGALEEALLETVLSGQVSLSEEPAASSPRHRELFRQALVHVRDAQCALAQGLPPDMLAIDVTDAVNALGEVTGETASEDLLDAIFHNFCVGK